MAETSDNTIDISRSVFEKYLALTDKRVEITLVTNLIITGHIAGYYKNDEEYDIPYIRQWHIVHKKENEFAGTGLFGSQEDGIIDHHQIKFLKFLEDNSSYIFI